MRDIMDAARSFLLGAVVSVLASVGLYAIGKWTGMTLFGLPEPDGFDNVMAWVFGLCTVVIVLFSVWAAYQIGESLRDWLSND